MKLTFIGHRSTAELEAAIPRIEKSIRDATSFAGKSSDLLNKVINELIQRGARHPNGCVKRP